MLAPPARIRRRTESQRALASRLAGTVADWQRVAHLAEAEARAAIAARLPLVRERLRRSPFWLAHLREAQLGLGELDLDSLTLLPPIDRATLARAGGELVGWAEGDDLVVVKSSGTSGEPVRVVKDRWDSLHMWAFLELMVQRLHLQLPARPRVVLLDALPGGLEYSVRLRLVGDGRGALHRLSLHHDQGAERLRRANPAVIFADPAGLHWLAARPQLVRPALIFTSASHFGAEQRARLSGFPIVNYYATTETGPIAWECLETASVFHVLAPEIWAESLAGELLVSRLRDSALPLLRYATGDRGEVARDACACGFHGWSIRGFRGRSACLFVTSDGRELDAWSLAWLFKQHDLAGFQLSQVGGERFTLGLARENAALVDALVAALRVLGFRAPVVETVPLATTCALKPEPFRRL